MLTLQLFEPNPNSVYTIDAAARLANVPRHSILVYYKHGFVLPTVNPERGGAYCFDGVAVRKLRFIETMRNSGINIAGIKMTLHLLNEVERLQAEVRFLRETAQAEDIF